MTEVQTCALPICTGNSARERNDVERHHNDGGRSADARSRTPTLAPLDAHDQEQQFLAIKSTRSRSPSHDGNEVGSDQEDWRVNRLQDLEIEIQEAKERLRLAQDALAKESSKSSSRSVSRSQHSRDHPIEDGKDVRHSRVSDENIRQAVRNLHDRS